MAVNAHGFEINSIWCISVKITGLLRKSSVVCALVAGVLALPSALPAADYGAPPFSGPALVETPCYAVFHELPDGQGLSLERLGPEAVERIRDLRYSDGGTLNTRVLSVTTGPTATLRLYNASRFRIFMFQVGPDSRVTLAHPVMDSYELTCANPPAPPGYAPSPGHKR